MLGFTHQLTHEQVLSAFVTRSVVTANANQRFQANDMHGYYWVGNPDIKPEVHKQAELGWQKGDELSQMGVSIFYDKVDDYILQYKQSEKVVLQKMLMQLCMGWKLNLAILSLRAGVLKHLCLGQ